MDESIACPEQAHGVLVDTPYGERLTCGECGKRWTRLHSEKKFVQERYSPMRDNCHG